MNTIPLNEVIVGIKGAGEMATGIACRLFNANFTKIFMMETATPFAVRRKVCFSEAIHDTKIMVEGVMAVKATSSKDAQKALHKNAIPVLVDTEWQSIRELKPDVVIDAILAKKNLGTHLDEAPLVIGLGPGFEAGKDVHILIETNRGHNLGRLILKGYAEPNTGIPGNIGGYTKKRVLRAPCEGEFSTTLKIGAPVLKNDIVGHVGKKAVKAQIDGILRGMIRPGTKVKNQFKIGDIDPRGNKEYCHTISEKARAIGGSVLEAILREFNKQKN
ncbi:MAG: EF2563 family selenium-dependent molybdenum hydroxylase system protein [Desulfobacteraceae bacterium]|nr:EF2563 family selenium-dependent molybdenum hydroxylase system protein [Desulfobacteraceae bacterium]